MDKLKGNLGAVLIAVAILILSVVLFVNAPKEPLKGAVGITASYASSTLTTVSAGTATTVAATSTCASRIVTTKASPVLLTFDDRLTPTPIYGHIQPASTTVSYNAEEYGCGELKALTADNLATVLSVTTEQ